MENIKQWDILKNLAQRGTIPQGIIFSGEKFLGKKKMALDFVKLLNCQEKDFSKRPCQKCLPCKLIEKENYPDFILITPNKGDIQISQIRDLQSNLNITPQLSNFKAVIIDKAERLNKQSQNCLLKILEEPKGKVLLIFITSCLKSLLDTVRSRCQVLRFYPTVFSLGDKEKLQEIERVVNLEIEQKISFCKNFFDEKNSFEGVDEFLVTFENYFRGVIMKKIKMDNELLNFLSLEIVENYSFSDITKTINMVEELRVLINTTNVNQKLALENLMVNICS